MTVIIFVFILMSFWEYKSYRRKLKKEISLQLHYKSYFILLNLWMKNRNRGEKLETFFLKNKIQTIAIYGIGELGLRLYEELKQSSIKICFFIDKNASKFKFGFSDIPIIATNEINYQIDVDAIVVTPIDYYELIEEELLENGVNTKIISLEEAFNL